jgi:FxLD family lantipeptide
VSWAFLGDHRPTEGVIGMTAAPVVLGEAAPQQIGCLNAAAFELDITVIEQADLGGLVRLTDDGCGSTCGACTTG